MILSKSALEFAFDQKILRAYRYDETSNTEKEITKQDVYIGPNSIDVTLASKFCILHPTSESGVIDIFDSKSICGEMVYGFDSFLLQPHQCVLGCTRERFTIGKFPFYDSYYDVVQSYVGRSTVGRLFLLTHACAGLGDVGFLSAWTLEIVNLSPHPIRLYPGMRIGQVVFSLVVGEAGIYDGPYNDQHDGPKLPQLGKHRFL